MSTSLSAEDSAVKDRVKDILDDHEKALAQKAARAFAVTYVNEIYKIISYMDPAVIEKLYVTRQYPYYLYIFIEQKEPGIIKKLMLYTTHKENGNGGCEVSEIHHTTNSWNAAEKIKMEMLANMGESWSWSHLDISEMYVLAISEGRRIGIDIYFKYAIAPLKKLEREHMSPAERQQHLHETRRRMSTVYSLPIHPKP